MLEVICLSCGFFVIVSVSRLLDGRYVLYVHVHYEKVVWSSFCLSSGAVSDVVTIRGGPLWGEVFILDGAWKEYDLCC